MKLLHRFGIGPVLAAALFTGIGAGTALTVGLTSNSSSSGSEHVLASDGSGEADESGASEESTTSTAVEATTTSIPAADETPPPLQVTEPADGAVLTDRHVRFAGVTEPGAAVSAGPYAADVGPDGSWSLVLVLSPGANSVAFEAVDTAGNIAEASLTVTYDAPAPPPAAPDDEDACASLLDPCEKDTCASTYDPCEKDTCASTYGECQDTDTCASTLDGCVDESDPCISTTGECGSDSDPNLDLETCIQEAGACPEV